MKTFICVGMVALVALSVGCSAPSKGPLYAQGYKEAETNIYVINTCVARGQMSPDTAATGQRLVAQLLGNHVVNPAVLDYERGEINRTRPPITQEHCNITSMKILQAKQMDTSSSQATAPSDTSLSQAVSEFGNAMNNLHQNSASFTNSFRNSLPSQAPMFGNPVTSQTNCLQIANMVRCKTQ